MAGVLALAVMAGEPRVGDQRQAPPPAPRLRVTQMAGELAVEPAQRREDGAGSALPYIGSGSTVRVLSGSADFESDYHALIRAKKGARFKFSAFGAKAGLRASLRIAQAAGGDPKALEVIVGGERFYLSKDGSALSIAPDGRGVVLRSEGEVQLVMGGEAGEGEAMAFGSLAQTPVALDPGTSLRLWETPGRLGFKRAPLDIASLSISQDSAETLAVAAAGAPRRSEGADTAIRRWPAIPRRVAELMMEKYGAPHEVSRNALVWNNNGPWKKTVVRRTGAFHDFPDSHMDVLEQSVAYSLAREKIMPLARLDAGVEWNLDSRELSAANESEEANFLALNVADDVVSGRLGVAQARELLKRTAAASNAGKSSPYTQRLLFEAR